MDKKRIRLQPNEIDYFNFNPKKNDNRYWLTEKQLQDLNELRSGTKTNQYEERKVLTALDNKGKLMDIDKYCKFYNIPRSEVRSYKLVTHTGIPYYNIASGNVEDELDTTLDELKLILSKEFDKYKHIPKVVYSTNKERVVKLSDLHFGAMVQNLIKTKDFNSEILIGYIDEIANIVNQLNSSKVHFHILGDLIESFTGLNHKNSWKSLDKNLIGAEVVKFTTKILHEHLLSKINNLGCIKIVAGNHDRVTAGKDEDQEGDAANLIAWGLGLIGYDVEFNPRVITHLVDGINHINHHGDRSFAKQSTKDICWDYGKQGYYNLITEGHLHTTIVKIKDTDVNQMRMVCPSLFTGNGFSEDLGHTSNAGFVVFENNGKGLPNYSIFNL